MAGPADAMAATVGRCAKRVSMVGRVIEAGGPARDGCARARCFSSHVPLAPNRPNGAAADLPEAMSLRDHLMASSTVRVAAVVGVGGFGVEVVSVGDEAVVSASWATARPVAPSRRVRLEAMSRSFAWPRRRRRGACRRGGRR